MQIKDPLSLRVLHALNTDAKLSAQAIAKRLRVHQHRVSYAERSLRNRFGLTTIPFINYGRLGMSSFLIYFSMNARRERARVIEAIRSHPKIGWLGESAGSFQFGCSLLASDIAAVGHFFESICDRFGEVFSTRQIAPRLSFEWLGRRYLSPNIKQVRSLRYTPNDELVEIDDLDIKLLSAIARSGTESIQACANLISIPYPTAVRRIRQLEDSGVIEGYFASINSKLIGREAYRLLIQTGTSSRKAANTIRSIATNDLRATYFVETLGPWEFEIGLELESAKELTDITYTVGSALDPHPVNIQVLIELSDLKWAFFPT